MKFTEGYWLRSERANALYATEAYRVEKIPGGMSVLATARQVKSLDDTVDMPALWITFVAYSPATIRVKAWHYEAFDGHVPEFEKQESIWENVSVKITEEEALLDTGLIQVRLDRKAFRYTFEKDGRILTSCGFRNLGYIRWDRQL